ncbi:MAG TPA: FAD-dependent oxidoreductase [Patescibacteria group bacterium]|nr:FAD-dependent oxidoreductase [Patescibacteria group bacterium]
MKQKINTQEKRNVVILGGGFAGVKAALELSQYLYGNDEFEIILVDRRDYLLYHAALYEAATTEHKLVEAKKVKKTVCIPYAEIFGRTKVKVFKGFIEGIDLEDGKVVTDSRIIYFDYLLVAMGSIADFYGIPNMEKYGFTLKSLEDAIMIRNRMEEIVSKKDGGRIVIGGGGFAGVEFAGELHNLIKHECADHDKNLENFKIMIVEGGTSFLSGLSQKISDMIYSRLAGMGVEIRFSTLVSDAGSNYVMLNNKEKIDCDLLIWTGGVRSRRIPFTQDTERDKKDRTHSTELLNLKKFPNVFLAGDNLGFLDQKTKKPLPQTAQEAIRQGAHAAKNIYRMIKRKELLPYHPGSSSFVIPTGGKQAIVYTPSLVISGFFGWLIRRYVDLRYFLGILPFFTALRFWLFENKIFMKND